MISLLSNPTKAYPDNDIEVSSLLKIKKEEVAEFQGDFSFQITEISRFVKAENNAELWKSVYGELLTSKRRSWFP